LLANYVRLSLVTSNNDEVVKKYCESVVNSIAADKGPLAPLTTPDASGATQQ
jgi:hypothetical protein